MAAMIQFARRPLSKMQIIHQSAAQMLSDRSGRIRNRPKGNLGEVPKTRNQYTLLYASQLWAYRAKGYLFINDRSQ